MAGLDPKDLKRLMEGMIATVAKKTAEMEDISEEEMKKNLLFMAVQSGNNRAVYGHLLNGASPNAKDSNGRSALHMAALDGHQDIFATLLTHQADPGVSDEAGITPLMCAAQKGSDVIVEQLLKKDVDVEKKNDTGLSAVFYALKNGHLGIAEALEQKKSCIHDIGEEHMAAIWEKVVHKNRLSIAKFLHDRGCTLSYRKKLSMASKAGLCGHTEMLQYFNDVNFEEKLEDGRSPLCGAVQNGFYEAVEYMLDNGCDVRHNEECVQVAILTGHLDVLKLLLDRGAPLYDKDENRVTPLQLAVVQAPVELFKFLLDRGCDLDSHEQMGSLTLMAASQQKLDVLRVLHKAGKLDTGPDKETGETALLAACQKGPVEAVELLIDAGCGLSVTNRRGVSPALRAAHCKQEDILMMLGDREAKLDIPNRIGETAILCAARNKSQEMVRYLADKGCDMKVKDVNGRTLAYYAVKKDNVALLQLMQQRKVSLDEPDATGVTPLMMAVSKGSLQSIKQLMSWPELCSVKHRDWSGRTSAHVAAASGNAEILKLLLENGADLHAIDSKGNTLLLEALQHKKCFPVVELLIKHDCDLQATDSNLNSAVHFACKLKENDCLMLLLEADVPFDTPNLRGMTPFLASSHGGFESIMMVLKAMGADVNKRNRRGQNAVHLAAEKGNTKIIHCLSLFGCAMDQEDRNGVTPLMVACSKGKSNMTSFLIRKKTDVNAVTHSGRMPAHYACEQGSLDVLKELADNGAELDAPDLRGITPILLAAKRQDTDFLKFLCERGCDVKATSKAGTSALHYAVEGNNHKVISFLVGKGLDANAADKQGMTAVLLSVKLNNTATLSELRTNGGRVEEGLDQDGHNAAHFACTTGNLQLLQEMQGRLSLSGRTSKGENCLSIACANGHEPVVRLLLDNKAYANFKTGTGENALTVAAKDGHTKLIPLLLERGVKVLFANADGDTALHILCSKRCTSKLDKVEQMQQETGEQLKDLKRLVQELPMEMQPGLDQLLQQAGQLPKQLLQKKVPRELLSKSELVTAIEALLKKDEIDVNAANKVGKTALHLACAAGNKKVIDLLLNQGANLEVAGCNGETPLFEAIRQEKEKVVALLVSKGAKCDVASKQGVTPMALAVASNNDQIIESLGCREQALSLRELQNTEFFPNLFKKQNLQHLDYLIANGLDGRITEKSSTLLHRLVSIGNARLLREFLQKYRDAFVLDIIDQPDNDGDTAFNDAMMKSRLDLAAALADAGCKLDSPNHKGHSALHVAAIQNKLAPIKWLLEDRNLPVSNETPDTDSPTPLQLAAIKGNLKVLQLLLDKGFQPDTQSKVGSTAAHYAAIHGNLHVIKVLYGHSPQLFDIENNSKLIPFDCAVLNGHLTVVTFLSSRKAEWLNRPQLMHLAIQLGHQHIVQWLQERGLETDVTDEETGETTFRQACHSGNYHLVKRLLKPELLESRNKHGNTAAQAAAYHNHRHLLRWLHEQRAPMDIADNDGDTTVLEAALKGHKESLELLHQYGCSLEHCNKRERGLTHLASMGGYVGVVQFATEQNLPLDNEDFQGNTALMYASYRGSCDIVDIRGPELL